MTTLAVAAPLSQPTAARLQAYVEAQYDPLTTPIDWYVQDPVVGDPLPLGPRAAVGKGIDATAVGHALAWAQAQGSTALIVLQGDTRLVEAYWQGDGRDTRVNSQSMAKTVAALLVGIAIDRGEIGAVDDPLGTYLPHWAGDARGAITIRQTLQMASGLAQVDGGHGYALTPDNPAVAQYFGQDYLGPALALPPVAPPGRTFDYNNNDVTIVAHLLERVSGKKYGVLLSERLFRPMRLGDAAIGVDRPGGAAIASANLFARPVDWAALGAMIVNAGVWHGKRIVSAAWIAAMTTPSPTNAYYGLHTWLGDHAIGGTPQPPTLTPWQSVAFAAPDMVLMNGFGGQRVWMMPDKRLVVVRIGRTWPAAWDDAMLPNLIWNGVAS